MPRSARASGTAGLPGGHSALGCSLIRPKDKVLVLFQRRHRSAAWLGCNICCCVVSLRPNDHNARAKPKLFRGLAPRCARCDSFNHPFTQVHRIRSRHCSPGHSTRSAVCMPLAMKGRFFWLTYHHPDGRSAGVVVIESNGLLHARLKGCAGPIAVSTSHPRTSSIQSVHAKFRRPRWADRSTTAISGSYTRCFSGRTLPASIGARQVPDGSA
jgi:hypothetical protein